MMPLIYALPRAYAMMLCHGIGVHLWLWDFAIEFVSQYYIGVSIVIAFSKTTYNGIAKRMEYEW